MIKFYCYSKCGTCKKAENYLKEHNIPFESLDIKTTHFSKNLIKDFHIKSKKVINKLYNTSGNLYKELGLKDKINKMSLDESYGLLSTDGMLVKRPILVDGEKVLFGFNEKEYEEVVKNASRS